MSIERGVVAFCQWYKGLLEGDYFPRKQGDKYNALEGVGALLYQPCIFNLAKTVRLFESTSESSWVSVAKKAGALATIALTSVVAGIGGLLKGIGYFLPHDKTVRTDAVFTKTSPEKIDHVYDVTQSFAEVASLIGLNYKMCGGTALGTLRNKGMIPWDDDADFVIMEDEKAKIEQAIASGVFARYGLEAQFYPGMENFEIRFTEEERKKRGYAGSAAIDLFLMTKRKAFEEGKSTEHICYASSFFSDQFPNEYLTLDEWNHPADWNFGPKDGILLKGFTQDVMERYVKRAYGDDCLDTGLKTHNHAEISLFGFKFSALGIPVVTREKVKIVDFNPAYGVKWRP
jgi:hypothetical protein